MRWTQLIRKFMIPISATALTALIVIIQFYQNTTFQTHLALQLAQQVSAQSEALNSYALEKQEKDPASFASRILAMNSESKIIDVIPINSDSNTNEVEKYKFNKKTNLLTYLKTFGPSHRSGVRIQIQQPYLGFLGARSLLGNDLRIFLLFLFISLLLKFSIEFYTHYLKPPSNETRAQSNVNISNVPPTPPISAPPKKSDSEFRTHLSQWIGEAKTVLIELSECVRNIVREAQTLTTASVRSKDLVEAYADKTTQLNEISKQIDDCLSLLEETKGNPATISGLATQLRQQLETSSTDIQILLGSYKDLFRSSQDMNIYITNTLQALIHESQMLEKLQAKTELTEKTH